MKVKLIVIGKTEEPYLNTGIAEYVSRLRHYIPLEFIVIPALKNIANLSLEQIKEKEAILLIKHIAPADKVMLLDEKAQQYSSKEFSYFMQQQMNSGLQNLVFIIGGAFGFSKEVYSRFPNRISLSKMTFSHQMIRLFFVEQLYRAMTILRNESYHHE